MVDIFTRKKRSEIMFKIKGRGTAVEEKGWAFLKKAGVRFRRHPKGVYGNPDAGHKGKKIAVFFDSEFWHGHDWKNQKKTIKSKQAFWIKKIERNMERDKQVINLLKKDGWKVLRIWTKEMQKKNSAKLVKKIKSIWH